eukprot:291525_1
MNMSLQFYALITLLNVIHSNSIVYVGRNGLDEVSCGVSNTLPCGTLQYASTLWNINRNEIYVIDGQNETQIADNMNKANNYTYHPCLMRPMSITESNITIYISFDANLITNMKDWYPQICINHDMNTSTNYINKYMFEITKMNLVINNLNINFQQYYNTSFGIIAVFTDYQVL